MGCTSTKNASPAQGNVEIIPVANPKAVSKPNSTNEKSSKINEEKSVMDKENRINLVFRLKRQNLFNTGIDLEQNSFTATSIPKNAAQTNVISKFNCCIIFLHLCRITP